jgi:aspartate aminotransferase-like enzyme
MQVVEALRQIHEEGLPQVLARHQQMSTTVARRLETLGLSPQCPSLRRRATTVTAVALPAAMQPAQLRDGLKARGILVAGGLERFGPSAFRIGHMGDIRPADIDRTMDALADVIGTR